MEPDVNKEKITAHLENQRPTFPGDGKQLLQSTERECLVAGEWSVLGQMGLPESQLLGVLPSAHSLKDLQAGGLGRVWLLTWKKCWRH